MCHTHASAARSNINAASNSSAVLHLASLYRAVFVGHVHAGSAANEYAGSSNEHTCPYEHAETAANLDEYAGSPPTPTNTRRPPIIRPTPTPTLLPSVICPGSQTGGQPRVPSNRISIIDLSSVMEEGECDEVRISVPGEVSEGVDYTVTLRTNRGLYFDSNCSGASNQSSEWRLSGRSRYERVYAVWACEGQRGAWMCRCGEMTTPRPLPPLRREQQCEHSHARSNT